MKQLGSTIECYRGETFTIRREFVDADGAPLVLTPEMRNPFLRFSVKSNTHRIDGEYVKNYWTDLSYLNREKYAILGPAEKKIFVNVTQNSFSGADKTTVIQATQQTPYVTFRYRGPYVERLYQMCIVCDRAPNTSTRLMTFSIAKNGNLDTTSVVLSLLGDDGVILGRTNLAADSTAFETYTFQLNAPYTRRLYLLFTLQGTLNANTDYEIKMQNVLGEYDVNQLYYRITPEGREYYTVDYLGNESEQPYKFELVRKFLNADTKKWIGQIYQYEIALCSGELMTDWLKKVFDTLYPNATFTPQSNDEFAHYICKKRPEILRWVNVNEPLVSYQTNKVLQGPCKLIVKEN